MLSARAGKDEVLGFGLAEAATFLTPLVLAVITEVVKFLAEEVKQSLKDRICRIKPIFLRNWPTPSLDVTECDSAGIVCCRISN
jgi:hypothetical protein